MQSPPRRTPPHPLAAWLRSRVLSLRAATPRRVFPAAVETVGVPASLDGPVEPALSGRVLLAEPTDHALRVDVLARLLTDDREAGWRRVWVAHVRPGWHEPTDSDLGWAAATTAAAQIGGVEVAGVVIVSRWGWRDVGDGTERSWVRLRAR